MKREGVGIYVVTKKSGRESGEEMGERSIFSV